MNLFGSLTKPAVVDPNTGAVMYEPDSGAAALELAKQMAQHVQPDQASLPQQLPQEDQPQQQPVMTPAPDPAQRIAQPSFSQAAVDSNGLPNAMGPGLTKGGKLLTLLLSGLKGAAAGAGSYSFGQGFQQAQNQPIQNQLGRGAIAQQRTVNELGQQRLQTFPWVRAQMQADLAKSQATAAEQGSLANLHRAQTEQVGEERKKAPDMNTLYATAVQDAVEQGLDPLNDPTVQKYADAIGNVQKQATPKEPNTIESLRQQIDAANADGDTGKVKSLQKRLMDLNPGAEQRLQVSVNNNAVTPPNPASVGKTGDEFLATVPPAQATLLKALADGRIPLPSSFALKTPYWQDILQKLSMYDPQFSTQRAEVRKAFTTGTDGRNIGALNTATVHLDALQNAAKALSNGQFVPGNQAYNYVQQLFGQSAPTNFDSIKIAVSGELAKALSGTATIPEMDTIQKGIANSKSPEQLAGYIHEQMSVLAQKMQTYQQRYQQQIPGDKTWSPILPQAQEVLQRNGVTAGGLSGEKPPAGAKIRDYTSLK